MPKYRLLSAAVIDGELMEAGREIEFDGVPGRHMEPLDAAAKKMQVPGPAPLDPLYLAHVKESDVVMTGFYGFHIESAPGSQPPMNVDVPHVSGTATVGSTLTCTMGNWTGEPTSYGYTWLSNGTGGAETPTPDNAYRIKSSDEGHSITCIVTATNNFGSTTAPPSNAVVVAAAVRPKTGGSRNG